VQFYGMYYKGVRYVSLRHQIRHNLAPAIMQRFVTGVASILRRRYGVSIGFLHG
jgi:hypothetical protein